MLTSSPLSRSVIALVLSSIAMIGCSRSPLEGAGNAPCGSGDRVILNERLFCVYEGARETRPADPSTEGQSEMTSGEMTVGGASVPIAGIESIGGTLAQTADSEMNYCPLTTPIAHRYETLTICGEVEISSSLVEAVVAQWSTEYADIDDTQSAQSGTDETNSEPMIMEAGSIGVQIDYAVPQGD